ncbi:hypothetical protein WBG78_28460 [Chryseolinea sp. T2]|uniref:hypothetical protein n=1 Tax=Chryseolinea sp. T2 TaxID=3129255 RepID=UPI0030779BAF
MPIPSEYPTLVNGEMYSWTSIRVQLSNAVLPLVSVTAISYSDAREKTNVYGVGDKPIGRSYGAVTNEGSITIHKDELRLFQDAAPFGDITLLDAFEITVSYRSTIAGKITTEVLKNVEFTSNPTAVAQGDTSIAIEIPLILAGIKRGNNPFY